jgi:putative FmdB family regulatory protein
MPVYLYRCQNCGNEFEKTQTYHNKPLMRCPECHKGSLERVPQKPAIIFKGTGWYSKDERSSSGQKSGTPDKKNDEKSGSTEKGGQE